MSRGQDAWKQLLSCLKLLPQDPQCELAVDDNSITITCTSAAHISAVKTGMQANLLIPEQLLVNMGVSLQQDETATVAESELQTHYETELPKPPEVGTGVATLCRFIGLDFEFFSGIRITWAEKFREAQDTPILFSKTPISDGERVLLQQFIATFIDTATKIPLSQLREMYQGKKLFAAPAADQPIDHRHTLDAGLLQRCFGFIQREQGTFLYCDYLLLHQLLYPPYLQENSDADQALFQLIISKQHLIAYLRQVFSEGIVLDVLQQHPILLPSPFSRVVPNVIILMLDVSGSMRREDRLYEDKVKQIITMLEQCCTGSDDKLVLVPFSDKQTLDVSCYPLAGAAKAVCRNPGWLTCSGGTRIYASLTQLFAHQAVQQYTPEQANLSLILVTDGCDNSHTQQCQSDFLQRKGQAVTVLPQIFTLGFGKEHDAKLCQELARITGGRYQELQDVSQLAAIEQYMREIAQPRVLVEFNQLAQQVAAQFFSIYRDPLPLSHTLAVGEEFMLNGRRMRFVTSAATVSNQLPAEAAQVAVAPPPGGVMRMFTFVAAARDQIAQVTHYCTIS